MDRLRIAVGFGIASMLLAAYFTLECVPFSRAELIRNELRIGTTTRTYWSYTPAVLPWRDLPLVVVVHGVGGVLGTPEKMFFNTGWESVAQQYCTKIVLPEAMLARPDREEQLDNSAAGYNPRIWNDGYVNRDQLRLADDIQFVTELLKQESVLGGVQARYAIGFSNGANFVGRLSESVPGIFAAVALVESRVEVSVGTSTKALRIRGAAPDMYPKVLVTVSTNGLQKEILIAGMGHVYPGAWEAFGVEPVGNVDATDEAAEFFDL